MAKGRPVLDPEVGPRLIGVASRLTEEERATLQSLADAVDISLCAYIRLLCVSEIKKAKRYEEQAKQKNMP